MKFIIVVVILVLAAVCSEGRFLPSAVVDVSPGVWGAPAYWGRPSLTTSPAWALAYAAAPYASSPYAAAHYGPTTAYQVDPLSHGLDGKYVAANRGSVHIAPLVGHLQSVSSTNLSPAPGTTW